jgi:general secretion pathway protein I
MNGSVSKAEALPSSFLILLAGKALLSPFHKLVQGKALLFPLHVPGEVEGEIAPLAYPATQVSSSAVELLDVKTDFEARGETSLYLSPQIRRRDRLRRRDSKECSSAGFTLIEVMVSLAIIAIALMALLGLQHQTLQSVVRASEMTTAALLAQEMMTQTEIGQFPAIGNTNGNFENLHPRQYPNFRWERRVEPSAVFPDIRKVRVIIHYGPRLHRSFELTEMIRNPLAIPGQNQ